MRYLLLLCFFTNIFSAQAEDAAWEYVEANKVFRIFNESCSITIDSSGSIYGYGNDGLHVYSNGEFSKIDSLPVQDTTYKLPSFAFESENRIYATDDEVIFAKRNLGYFHLDKKKKWSVTDKKNTGTLTNRFHGFALCKNGSYWFANNNNLVHFDGKNYKEYKHDFDTKFFMASQCMECIDNELWYIPGYRKSIIRFNDKTDNTEHAFKDAVKDEMIWKIEMFKTWDEELVVTYPGGQVQIWKNGQIIKEFHIVTDCTVKELLPEQFKNRAFVQDVVKDHKGNYWFMCSPSFKSKYYQYLVKLDKEGNWSNPKLPNQQFGVGTFICGGIELAPDGKIWFSTVMPKLGLFSYDPRKSSVDNQVESVHDVFTSKVIPNPVKNISTVKFYCPANQYKTLEVKLYDIMGREIKKIDNNTFTYDASTHYGSFSLSRAGLRRGVYYLHYRIGGSTATTGVIIE